MLVRKFQFSTLPLAQLEYPPYEVSGMQIRIENISDGSEEQLNFHLDFSSWNENASFKTGKCNRENC